LLAGGATEVVIRDGHGTGGWPNIIPDMLPERTRLFAEGDDFSQFQAALQVGLHARCGTADGFISHTNIPEFRIRVNGNLITECHDDAWTAGLPLLGIIGDGTLGRELDGSLSGIPFLGVQRSISRTVTEPVHQTEAESLEAIRGFASACIRVRRATITPVPPDEFTVEISLRPDLADLVYTGSKLTRTSPSVLQLSGSNWRRDAKPWLAAAISAGLRPWSAAHDGLDLTTEAQMLAQPEANLARLRSYIEGWMLTNYPAWAE
jgi:D-aminopeptidase